MTTEIIDRAQGCLLGQLAGDALGGQVEFQPAAAIVRAYPSGVRDLRDGGHWGTLAGQPTDDSEMALLLARSLVSNRGYDAVDALKQYRWWLLESTPFDVGNTIRSALTGKPTMASQANGALMRASPLGIFGWNLKPEDVARIAAADARLTHPNKICCDANALFTLAIATAIREALPAVDLCERVEEWMKTLKVDDALKRCVGEATERRPLDYQAQQGWVLIAFGNALYQLRHAANLEEAVVDTVMQGGDTDTNAAIAGALCGAVYGAGAVPIRWTNCVLECRPSKRPGVLRPRPEILWPADALALAEALVDAGQVPG